MNFYETLYDLASVFPEKGRKALLVAMLDYFFAGSEPDSLGVKERKAFEAVRGRIDASKANGNNRRGKKRNETDNETHNETDNETRNETGNEKCDSMRADISPSPSLSLSKSSSLGMGRSCDYDGEGFQGEGFSPPTAEECAEYFAASCLKGDPSAFHDHFAAQGWVRGNGLPVGDWMALARQWSAKQVEIDAQKPPEPPKPKRAANALSLAEQERELERMKAARRARRGDDL